MFRLFGGKHPEFTIEIDRADAVYYPGDTVRAKVTLASEREAKFDEITVGLLCEERLRRRDGGEIADDAEDLWHTDARWAGREIIAREGTLPAKYRQTYELAWQIPAQVTASYNGELAQVRWMVRASVDRQGTHVVTRDTPLGVVVAPPNHFVSPGEFIEDNPASRTIDVKFALPKLEYVQNEEVTGRLLLVAREQFTADNLQIELVRTEHVSAATAAAAGAITRRVVEAAQTLAQNVALGASDPLGFDFRLQVPPKWCPSYRTPHGYAIWQLQVTIPSATSGESRAIQSLLVFNGYANADSAEAGASANQNFAHDFPAARPATESSASEAYGQAFAELQAPHGTSMPLDSSSVRNSDRLTPPIESPHASPLAPENPYAASLPPRNVEPEMNPFRKLASESESLQRDPQSISRDSSPFALSSASDLAPSDAPPSAPLQARDTAEPLRVVESKPQPKRRFCTNCGTPMPYEANFCPACGTPVHRGEGYY